MRPRRGLGQLRALNDHMLSQEPAAPASPSARVAGGKTSWQAEGRARALALPNRGPLMLVDGLTLSSPPAPCPPATHTVLLRRCSLPTNHRTCRLYP
jgi:hypothetical protein